MNTLSCTEFIQKLPKAELHVHIEGAMEPEQLLLFAQRNKIEILYNTIEEAKEAYNFSDYQSFVDAYIQITRVLCTEQDFYELTMAYLHRIAKDGVLHTEIFFDLQTYMPRNLSPALIINGIYSALQDGQKQLGISSNMIMCFIRHLSEEDALAALTAALDYKDKIVGVGLASLEEGNPPSKFAGAFAQAQKYGFKLTAHASYADFIYDSIHTLGVERIDHGIGCMQNPDLTKKLINNQMPITVCPLSNVLLGRFIDLKEHPIKKMFDAGLNITINSDDPAFFGGYIAHNYLAIAQHLNFSCKDLTKCARNSFQAAFINKDLKKVYLEKLNTFSQLHSCNHLKEKL